MKLAASFSISEFTNPSGEVVFRVSGTLEGKRVRKNFPTRAEAKAEADVLELQRLQADSGLRPILTRLTDTQAHEAEAAFRRLEGRTRSLLFYLDIGLANHRDALCDTKLTEAAKAYLALREQDHKQGNLSHRQYTSFRCELRALETAFLGKAVSELAAADLEAFFKRKSASKKTYNNRRGLIGAFLRYCLLKDWVGTNVIEKVPFYRGIGHRRGSAKTLTAEECAEMMEWVETRQGGVLVPFAALCLFAGVRPDLYEGEISKLQPEHVRLDTGVILIEPDVSKVRMKRAITIQPNLAAWLRAYPLEKFPIWPRGFRRLRLEFRKKFKLSHDVLRHTFISMFVGKFRSLGEAALQAGNSETIIRKHYLDLKSKEEAERFFAIRPKHCSAPGLAAPGSPAHSKPAGRTGKSVLPVAA